MTPQKYKVFAVPIAKQYRKDPEIFDSSPAMLKLHLILEIQNGQNRECECFAVTAQLNSKRTHLEKAYRQMYFDKVAGEKQLVELSSQEKEVLRAEMTQLQAEIMGGNHLECEFFVKDAVQIASKNNTPEAWRKLYLKLQLTLSDNDGPYALTPDAFINGNYSRPKIKPSSDSPWQIRDYFAHHSGDIIGISTEMQRLTSALAPILDKTKNEMAALRSLANKYLSRLNAMEKEWGDFQGRVSGIQEQLKRAISEKEISFDPKPSYELSVKVIDGVQKFYKHVHETTQVITHTKWMELERKLNWTVYIDPIQYKHLMESLDQVAKTPNQATFKQYHEFAQKKENKDLIGILRAHYRLSELEISIRQIESQDKQMRAKLTLFKKAWEDYQTLDQDTSADSIVNLDAKYKELMGALGALDTQERAKWRDQTPSQRIIDHLKETNAEEIMDSIADTQEVLIKTLDDHFMTLKMLYKELEKKDKLKELNNYLTEILSKKTHFTIQQFMNFVEEVHCFRVLEDAYQSSHPNSRESTPPIESSPPLEPAQSIPLQEIGGVSTDGGTNQKFSKYLATVKKFLSMLTHWVSAPEELLNKAMLLVQKMEKLQTSAPAVKDQGNVTCIQSCADAHLSDPQVDLGIIQMSTKPLVVETRL